MAGSPADSIHVKVHARVLHRIDARLFGQFMEKASWGSEIGSETAVIPGTHELRPQAKELIRQMQIPIVRFPGGTDADYIDWLDMIDHVPGRMGNRPLTKGHTGNQVTNYFGYDEFLRLCEDLKMEPLLDSLQSKLPCSQYLLLPAPPPQTPKYSHSARQRAMPARRSR